LTQTKHWPVLIGFLVLCFVAAGIGGAVTAPNIPTWYAGLVKPSFQPPSWLFAPVWTALYAIMALTGWMVWRAAGPGGRATPIGLFLLQLALNAIWSPLFFGMHLLLPALIDIGLLWLAIAATIIAFLRVSSRAGLLLLPYLVWVSFAGALNLAILRLNG
jgi:benzodiazapine receptor